MIVKRTSTMSVVKPDQDPWKCPKCSAAANKCGKEVPHTDDGIPCSGRCMGLICDCDHTTSKNHGTDADPCQNANCYHCGWGGTVPMPAKKLVGWQKKAWDAGWRPPK